MKSQADVLLELAGELQFDAADISHDLLAYPDQEFMFPGDIDAEGQLCRAYKYAQARAVYEAWRTALTLERCMVEMEGFFEEQELPPYRDPWDYGACEEP